MPSSTAMRWALLADVHANAEALSASLEHAQRRGAESHAFLGDLVGYGADPAVVVDRVRAEVKRGAVAVLGNHDQAVARQPSGSMDADASRVIEWTRNHLDRAQIAFLADLPLTVVRGGRLFVHANAWDPGGWAYITRAFDAGRSLRATDCRQTFCGHVHQPGLYHLAENGTVSGFQPTPGTGIRLGTRRRWLVIPGSVGQPRDGNPAACLRVTARRVFDTEPGSRLACITVLRTSRFAVDLTVDAEGRNLRVIRLVELKDWARMLGVPGDRLTFHVLEHPDPARAIIEFATSNGVDHIVIGARGSSALRRDLGSVSSQVVAEAECTVTVVKAP